MPTAREPDAIASRRSEPTEFTRNEEDQRVLSFPFSSETPVNRGYLGEEVLDHSERSVDLSRLNDSAPLLWNHNPDVVLGVVERAWLDSEKRRGHVEVRFSRNEKASQVLADINDGILRNVSTGYAVNQTEQGDGNQYRVMSWLPSEVSIVSCAADASVGLGRSMGSADTSANEGAVIMIDKADTQTATVPTETQAPKMTTATVDQGALRAEIAEQCRKEERARIEEIRALCSAHRVDDVAGDLINNNATVDQARAAVLDVLKTRPAASASAIELTEKEQRQYSIGAGVASLMTGDWTSRDAGYVRELSQEVEQRGGVQKTARNSFLIPFSAFGIMDSKNLQQRAVYQTGTANIGGNLVATDYLEGDFISALRNQSKMLELGCRIMSGLVGDISIPKQTGVGTTYWLASETTAITASSGTFGQVSMSPKNVGMLQKFTRQQALQGRPDIDSIIRSDIVTSFALAMDLAILNGSGTGVPTGVLQTSGIGSVAMGTNGGNLTMEKMIDLETEVKIANGVINPDSLAYLSNGKVVAQLKKTRVGGSTSTDGPFMWNQEPMALGRGITPGSVNGYRFAETMQVPSDLTKGTSSSNCSAVLFGDFSQIIVGQWGNGVEIIAGEDGDDFSKAQTSIRGIMSMDACIRNAESFAAIKDVTA